MRSFTGGASDRATCTPLISPLAGFHDRRWIVGFGIDPANPQIFGLMKQDSSLYLIISYLSLCTVSTWRAAAGGALWETVGQPLAVQASTAGLPHLDRLGTLEPRYGGTVDPVCFSPHKIANRFSAGSSGPFLCSAEGPCRNHTLGCEPVWELGLCTHVNLTVGENTWTAKPRCEIYGGFLAGGGLETVGKVQLAFLKLLPPTSLLSANLCAS